jgi:hypothetical protein
MVGVRTVSLASSLVLLGALLGLSAHAQEAPSEPTEAADLETTVDVVVDPDESSERAPNDPVRLRDLGRGAGELRAEATQSYLRLRALEDRIFGDTDTGAVTVVHDNGVGPFYRLVEVTYAIDGEVVFQDRDEGGRLGQGEVEVHEGLLAPGEHRLNVVLRFVGDGGPMVTYLEGYAFRVRSSHAFLVQPGQRTVLRLRTFNRGPEVPYEDRLGLSMERSSAELTSSRRSARRLESPSP